MSSARIEKANEPPLPKEFLSRQICDFKDAESKDIIPLNTDIFALKERFETHGAEHLNSLCFQERPNAYERLVIYNAVTNEIVVPCLFDTHKINTVLPLSTEKFCTVSSNGIQIWNTNDYKNEFTRNKINIIRIHAVSYPEKNNLIILSKNKKGMHILTETSDCLEDQIVITLDYIHEEKMICNKNKIEVIIDNKPAYQDSFIFKNKFVLVTQDGMFHIYNLPLTKTAPLKVQGIPVSDLTEINATFHVWPDLNLLVLKNRKKDYVTIWNIDDNLSLKKLLKKDNIYLVGKNYLADGSQAAHPHFSNQKQRWKVTRLRWKFNYNLKRSSKAFW